MSKLPHISAVGRVLQIRLEPNDKSNKAVDMSVLCFAEIWIRNAHIKFYYQIDPVPNKAVVKAPEKFDIVYLPSMRACVVFDSSYRAVTENCRLDFVIKHINESPQFQDIVPWIEPLGLKVFGIGQALVVEHLRLLADGDPSANAVRNVRDVTI